MANDLLETVIRLTLAGSMGVLAVLLTRRLVRVWFGPQLAYRLWLVVPAAALAPLLPLASVDFGLPAVDLPFDDGVASPAALPAVSIQTSNTDWSVVLAGVWLLGAVAFGLAIILEHRRALRAYGKLTPAKLAGIRVHRTSRPGAGPSLVGVFRPQLIVPADFETRFTVDEQQLVLDHERQHRRAGDPLVNGVVAITRCLNWFNPLVHVAAMMLRIDQELACDAAVIARRPGERRTYGEALLKTQLAPVPTSLGCHWPGRSGRMLVERIEMLGREKPRGVRLVGGGALVLAIGFGTGLAAWAAAPSAGSGPTRLPRISYVGPAMIPAGKAWATYYDGESPFLLKGRVIEMRERAGMSGELVVRAHGDGRLFRVVGGSTARLSPERRAELSGLVGQDVVVRGYLAHDKTCEGGCIMNGQDLKHPDGQAVFKPPPSG